MLSFLKKYPLYIQMFLILFASFILIFPQLYLRGVIIGSDAIFHYNRFYDVSEQIKNGNYQYFISMYGFQQSGRIINALYGPLFAYFQGIIVIISKSWFQYQIISNFILYIISGFSMLIFLKKIKVNGWISAGFSIFFMTTYPIQYWIDQQGLSAWPAAILPLCMIPLIKLIEEKKLSVIGTSVAISAMFQVHVLSTIFLVMVYFFFFIYSFLTTDKKKSLFKELIISIFSFLLLTTNVWVNMIDVYLGNRLVSPFLNEHMENNTITANSSYWVEYPKFLPVLFAVLFCGILNKKYKFEPFLKIIVAIVALFTILSTNFIPWKFLSSLENPILGLIQFPFRFVITSIVLLLIGLAIMMRYYKGARIANPFYLAILLCLSLVQINYMNTSKMIKWHQSDTAVNTRVNSFVFEDDEFKMKNQLFSKDKQELLLSFQKSTPDYLPLYNDDKISRYGTYGDEIIQKNHFFEKSVVNGKLQVTWKSNSNKSIKIPIIKYKRTNLILNGNSLSDEDFDVNTIGVVTVNQVKGENNLIVSYNNPWFFSITIIIPCIVLLFFIIVTLIKKYNFHLS